MVFIYLKIRELVLILIMNSEFIYKSETRFPLSTNTHQHELNKREMKIESKR